jgi:hypothetical protein
MNNQNIRQGSPGWGLHILWFGVAFGLTYLLMILSYVLFGQEESVLSLGERLLPKPRRYPMTSRPRIVSNIVLFGPSLLAGMMAMRQLNYWIGAIIGLLMGTLLGSYCLFVYEQLNAAVLIPIGWATGVAVGGFIIILRCRE